MTPIERLTNPVEDGNAHGCSLAVQEGLWPGECEPCQRQRERLVCQVRSW